MAPDTGTALAAPRLLRADEVHLSPDDRVVRQGITGHVIVAMIFFALAAWMAWLYRTGGIRWEYAAAIGGLATLFACGVVAGMIEVLRKDEWLMAIGPDAVRVRFHLRWDPKRPADEPQIVELPLEQVEAVQPVQFTRSWPGRGDNTGKEQRTATYLDFRVPGMDLRPLANALERERNRFPYDTSRYPRPDPVLVTGDNVLRVSIGSTRPGADEVRQLVGAWLPMEEEMEETVWVDDPPVRKPLRKVR